VVDAVVVTVAEQSGAITLTGDSEDIERLARSAGKEAAVFAV
jgi:hypothetical protein